MLGVGVALATTGAASPAWAEPVCGPARATTLARSDQARVYADRGAVFGCHRADRDAARPLGGRSSVLSTRVAGRYAAVERRGAGAPGERLTVYDLRRRRRTVDVRLDRGADRGGLFTRVRLDASGIAAYIADLPAAADRPARVEVRTTEDANVPLYVTGPDIGRRTLGFAGSTVAWRHGPNLEVSSLAEQSTSPGMLIRFAGLRIDAGERGLILRPAGRRAIPIGGAEGVCQSSSGCGGVDELQRAGRFVAVSDSEIGPTYAYTELRVADLATGEFRPVHLTDQLGDAGVYSFVVTESGATAFIVGEATTDASFSPLVTRLRTGSGQILDEGPGIDRDSLRRRGDQLVWRHDGRRRTAPLPR